MHDILSRVFEWSYFAYFGMTLAMLFVWILFAFFFRKNKRIWQMINIIAFSMTMLVILYVTVFSRSTDKSQVVRLTPFSSFVFAKEYNDVYKQMVMNIILFVPLGLTLPFAVSQRKHPVSMTILIAMLLSLGIETIQFAFHLGETETDDVIFNTLGAAVGTLPYVIMKRIHKHGE